MEVERKRFSWLGLKDLFLKRPIPFAKRRDLNWPVIMKVFIGAVVSMVLVLLFLPDSTQEETNFLEKGEGASSVLQAQASDPSYDTWAQLQYDQASPRNIPRSLDHLYQGSSSSGFSHGSGRDRSGSMILSREGLDSKTQLPPGSRMAVRLLEKVVVTQQAVPVIGVVASDVIHEDRIAVPRGSKVFGEISFNESLGRAQVTLNSLQFPDGRQRQVSALGIGRDGQIGVEGKIHSKALRNAVGQTLTRFIGAYAEGSVSRGAFGAQEGGHENGMKAAVAETAKDRAELWAEDLKKEKRWIEIKAGAEFNAVFDQAFSFRDPGAIYGN